VEEKPMESVDVEAFAAENEGAGEEDVDFD